MFIKEKSLTKTLMLGLGWSLALSPEIKIYLLIPFKQLRTWIQNLANEPLLMSFLLFYFRFTLFSYLLDAALEAALHFQNILL